MHNAPRRYMAPELMADGGDETSIDGDKLRGQTERAARAVDIYSFGITMYSVMSQVCARTCTL